MLESVRTDTAMRIAMISEHASPLAHIGGVDAGGQNVAVAELSAALARQGHEVVVYTRRDDAGLPERERGAGQAAEQERGEQEAGEHTDHRHTESPGRVAGRLVRFRGPGRPPRPARRHVFCVRL